MLTDVGETAQPGKVWDDRRAWDITCRLEAHIRKNQPKGWRATPEEDRKIDALVARRRAASEARDMDAYERAHHEILTICLGSWKHSASRR